MRNTGSEGPSRWHSTLLGVVLVVAAPALGLALPSGSATDFRWPVNSSVTQGFYGTYCSCVCTSCACYREDGWYWNESDGHVYGGGSSINACGGGLGGYHRGIDFGVGCGTAVYAARGGTVSNLGSTTHQYGYHVVVDHGGGYYTLYAHLSSYSVTNGAAVSAGQQIGVSGNTGVGGACHLHFEIRKGNSDTAHYAREAYYVPASVGQSVSTGSYIAYDYPGIGGNNPIGAHDGVYQSGYAWGWACDKDQPSTSIGVHLYLGGPAGSGAPGYSTVTNLTSESAVNTLCGGGSMHRWFYYLPNSIYNYGKPVYAYGINVGAGSNALLNNSPRTFAGCLGSGAFPKGVHDGRTYIGQQVWYTWGWACDPDNPNVSTDVHVYIGGPAGSGAPAYAKNANLASESAVTAQCGGGNYHRWNLYYGCSPLGCSAYAYGINICGGGNKALSSTPR